MAIETGMLRLPLSSVGLRLRPWCLSALGWRVQGGRVGGPERRGGRRCTERQTRDRSPM